MYRNCITAVEEVKAYIADSKVVAFKIHTASKYLYRNDKNSDFDPAKAKMIGCAFAVQGKPGIYVPIAHRFGKNIDSDEFQSFLKEFLSSKDIVKVAHDLAFDSSMVYADKGIVIQSPCYDTLCAAQLSYKNNTHEFRKQEKSDLASLVNEIFEESMPILPIPSASKHPDDFDGTNPRIVDCFAAEAEYALRLYGYFNEWFDKNLPRHKFIVENLESPVAVYVGIMKKNGLPVDIALMEHKRTEAKAELEMIYKEIERFVGKVKIGAACSTEAFRTFLYKELELPILKTTKNAREAMDDKAMKLLREWCDTNRPKLSYLFDLVQKYRKCGQLKSTFLDGYTKHLNDVTGCVHPDFYSLSTKTGRMSCCNPNAQNMPQKANDSIGIRELIKAPDGHLILSLDFSQIELRVGTVFSRDRKMLHAYYNNEDLHAITTSIIFAIPVEEAANRQLEDYKERRTVAKSVNFGILYGLYPRGLQEMLAEVGIEKTLDECKMIIENIKTGYKGLAIWQSRTKKETEKRQYSESCLGRRRYLPDITATEFKKKSSAERQALNHPIQATAADIIKLAMVRILNGLSAREWLKPIMQIHDELVFVIQKDKLEEAVSFVRSCMEKKPFEGFDVPLIVEACAGPDFGTMQEV